jgi:hypothetical protein
VNGQNGAGSLASDESTTASELDAGACGSGSPRSSLRTTSARMHQNVCLLVLAFFAFTVSALVRGADEVALDEHVRF